MLSSCNCSILLSFCAMKGIPIGPLAQWGKDLTYYLTSFFCLVNWDMCYPGSASWGTDLPPGRIIYMHRPVVITLYSHFPSMPVFPGLFIQVPLIHHSQYSRSLWCSRPTRFLVPAGGHSSNIFGHLFSSILLTWLYHCSCRFSILSFTDSSIFIILLIFPFLSFSNVDTVALLVIWSISTACITFFGPPIDSSLLPHMSIYTTLHKMPGGVDYSFCLFLKSKNSPLYTSGSHFIHSTAMSIP